MVKFNKPLHDPSKDFLCESVCVFVPEHVYMCVYVQALKLPNLVCITRQRLMKKLSLRSIFARGKKYKVLQLFVCN